MHTAISSKSIQNTALFIVAICINTYLACAEDQPKKNLDQYLDRIERILEHIPEEKVYEERIAHGKRLIINDILIALERKNAEAEKLNEVKKDAEAHFYEPKYPKPLTEEEKKENIKNRITKKFIGELPSQIDDVIDYYSNHKEWVNSKVGIHNRVLLHGAPGTGKTHLVNVLSEELEMPILSFSASFFADKYIGEASRKVRKAFEVAKQFDKPIFIFIDEIDALATERSGSTHNEHRATLITLLTELQELQDNKNVFIFVATNNIGHLDAAIKDRFAGSIIPIEYLKEEQRAQLFKKLYADKGNPIPDEFAQRLAEVTERYEEFKYSNGIINYSSFSNRDIKYIVDTSLFKFHAAWKKNHNCDRQLCKYVRQAIDQGNYKAEFGTPAPAPAKNQSWWSWSKDKDEDKDKDKKKYEKYCDGI